MINVPAWNVTMTFCHLHEKFKPFKCCHCSDLCILTSSISYNLLDKWNCKLGMEIQIFKTLPMEYEVWNVFVPFPQSFSQSVSSVQSLSHVRLFVTPWIAARQASLSITNSQSLLRLLSTESVMPSSHLILSRPSLWYFVIVPGLWFSCSVVSDSATPWTPGATRLPCPWDFPGKSTGVGCRFLFQGILLTQVSVWVGRRILYHWAMKEAPEWTDNANIYIYFLVNPLGFLLTSLCCLKIEIVLLLPFSCGWLYFPFLA